ncbi:MAG: EAL domain-containing protein [Geminicoccaceae bacterium]
MKFGSGFRDRMPIALLAVCLAATLVKFGLIKREELWGQDCLSWFSPSPDFHDVAMVVIDDASLEEFGRWPWSRGLHAEIIDRIARNGARSIGVNIVFAERSKNDPDGDEALVEAVRRAGNVALATLPKTTDPLGTPFEVMPFPELADAAVTLGDAQIELDPDMRARQISRGSLARVTLGVGGSETTMPRGLVGILPPIRDLRDIDVIPVTDLLSDTFHTSRLRNRMVIVTQTAEGMTNKVWLGYYNTPDFVSTGLAQTLALAGLDERRILWIPQAPTALATGLTIIMLLPFMLLGHGFAAAVIALAVGLLLAITSVLGLQLLLPVVVPTTITLSTHGLFGVIGSIRRHRRSALAAQRAHRALEAISDAVITTAGNGRINYANHSAIDLLGSADREVVGVDIGEVLPDTDLHDDSDLTIQDRKGRRRIFRTRRREIMNGDRTDAVIALTDVTADRQLVEEINQRALRDSLTGLANRQAIEQHLTKMISRPDARQTGSAAAILDLDRFKAINDALGHTAGDHVIFELCYRLVEGSLPGDRLGRTGGDELTLVLDNVATRDQANERIVHYRNIIAKPIMVHGEELHLRASIGVALFPGDGENADELLRHADGALQRAKEIGGNDVVFHQSTSSIDGRERLWLERELRIAFQTDQLEMHYQPRFEIDTRQMTGLEALVRWRHPQRGLVAPGAFITFAEETGLICELGRLVLRKSCRELVQRTDAGGRVRLSVNASVVQLRCDPDFVDFVKNVLHETGLPAGRLEIEVTESLFLDPALALVGQQLEGLAGLGIQLSIDDFGTGYSSLAYLNRFPFSRIKIDRSFVNQLSVDPHSQAIVSAIVGLGHSLHKSTTAEGVENAEQLTLLAGLGCDEVQGFLLGRPQPLDAFPQLF